MIKVIEFKLKYSVTISLIGITKEYFYLVNLNLIILLSFFEL